MLPSKQCPRCLAFFRRDATSLSWVNGGTICSLVDRSCLIALCFCISWSQPVGAKPAKKASAGTEQAKQEVFTALSVGNPGHAEEIIDRAFRADPDPAFLYQLGLVAQAQGRSVAALDLYRRYQELAGATVSPETTSAIEHFAAGMTDPVTVLNITAKPGMLLCVDDKIVGMLPLRTPLLLAGGTHRFRMEGPGERLETGALTIPDGREAELRLIPGAKGTAVALLSLSPITLLVLQPKSLPDATTQAVYKALVDAVRKDHLAPLPKARLDTLLRKQPADCLDQPDCQYAVAEEAQARSVLRVAVTAADPKAATSLAPTDSCSVMLTYLDVNAGQVTSTAEAKSTVCAGSSLTESLAAALQQLLTESDSRPRGMVAVSSVPIGAQVRVDGLLRGRTPYLKTSFGGVHQILVEKADFHAFQTRVEVVMGKVATVQAELSALPPEEPEPPPTPLQIIAVPAAPRAAVVRRRPRWRLALGGVAAGSGILLTGLGISALSLDGQCTQTPAEGAYCRGAYATTAVGGGLLGAGLALTVGGVVLLAMPGHLPKE